MFWRLKSFKEYRDSVSIDYLFKLENKPITAVAVLPTKKLKVLFGKENLQILNPCKSKIASEGIEYVTR